MTSAATVWTDWQQVQAPVCLSPEDVTQLLWGSTMPFQQVGSCGAYCHFCGDIVINWVDHTSRCSVALVGIAASFRSAIGVLSTYGREIVSLSWWALVAKEDVQLQMRMSFELGAVPLAPGVHIHSSCLVCYQRRPGSNIPDLHTTVCDDLTVAY